MRKLARGKRSNRAAHRVAHEEHGQPLKALLDGSLQKGDEVRNQQVEPAYKIAHVWEVWAAAPVTCHVIARDCKASGQHGGRQHWQVAGHVVAQSMHEHKHAARPLWRQRLRGEHEELEAATAQPFALLHCKR